MIIIQYIIRSHIQSIRDRHLFFIDNTHGSLQYQYQYFEILQLKRARIHQYLQVFLFLHYVSLSFIYSRSD